MCKRLVSAVSLFALSNEDRFVLQSRLRADSRGCRYSEREFRGFFSPPPPPPPPPAFFRAALDSNAETEARKLAGTVYLD